MTELGKQVWDKMEEMGWKNAPEGFHLEYYENIIECTKQVLTIPDVGGSLPTDEDDEPDGAIGDNRMNGGKWVTEDCNDHTPYWGVCGTCGRY